MIIRVTGHPMPKGSWTSIRRGTHNVLIPAGTKKSRELYADWAYAVEQAGVETVTDDRYYPTVHAVSVNVDFRLHRGKTVRRIMHTVAPDVDKLARAVLDPLTGIVWKDDSQVVDLQATKRYCRADEQPGATIYITILGEEQ
jgi:Holliday junction resolvase RusA-like endonuclease